MNSSHILAPVPLICWAPALSPPATLVYFVQDEPAGVGATVSDNLFLCRARRSVLDR